MLKESNSIFLLLTWSIDVCEE
jgi:hypothetical protein